MFKALLALLVIFFIATFPATWLLMLFLGNVGTRTCRTGVPCPSASSCPR